MPRARMIKPEFFDDEEIAHLNPLGRLLYIGMWVQADDSGNVPASPGYLRAKIFPYDTYAPGDLTGQLNMLVEMGKLVAYAIDGHDYYHIANFTKHQYIKKPSGFRFPAPPEFCAGKDDEGHQAMNEVVPYQYPTSTPLVPHQYGTSTSQNPLYKSINPKSINLQEGGVGETNALAEIAEDEEASQPRTKVQPYDKGQTPEFDLFYKSLGFVVPTLRRRDRAYNMWQQARRQWKPETIAAAVADSRDYWNVRDPSVWQKGHPLTRIQNHLKHHVKPDLPPAAKGGGVSKVFWATPFEVEEPEKVGVT